jgi:hypothetical protein
MKKPFDNQFATQRLLSEEGAAGGSTTGGGVTNGATFKSGAGEGYATTKAFKRKAKNETKDVEPKLAAGKANNYVKKKWKWKEAPSIPNRPSTGGYQYKQLFEKKVGEGVLQPVNTNKDSLSPMEYQQAVHYKGFEPNEWKFDDVSKRYVKVKPTANKSIMKEGMTFNKFKKESATRSDADALHEALKMIHKKMVEADRLLEFSVDMKHGLQEGCCNSRTSKVVDKLHGQIVEMYKKVKQLK